MLLLKRDQETLFPFWSLFEIPNLLQNVFVCWPVDRNKRTVNEDRATVWLSSLTDKVVNLLLPLLQMEEFNQNQRRDHRSRWVFVPSSVFILADIDTFNIKIQTLKPYWLCSMSCCQTPPEQKEFFQLQKIAKMTKPHIRFCFVFY